jgi:hypothetical protein
MLMAAAGDENDGDENDHVHAVAVHAVAVHAVADGLTGQGLDILGQEWEEARYLKATNAWGARGEATVGANGVFTWEYYAAGRRWDDPAQIADMALILLGADPPADGWSAERPRYPGQSFRSAVGMIARCHGLQARLDVLADPVFLEVSADVEITNPSRPERGAVRVRDGALRWECRLAGAGGLDVAEITETIGRSVPQLRMLDRSFGW